MEGQPAIRLLIVEAHAMFRGGLRYYLQAADDIVVVGEAASGPEALALVDALAPDVVIVNIAAPDLEGITTTQQLHQRCPLVRVLVLGNSAEGELVQRALRAGAIGYVQTDGGDADLAGAIRQAHAGQAVLAPTLAQAIVATSDQPPKPGAKLSARELEVLRLMVSGRSNEHIAGQLAISRNTVRHHVHNILTKLGVVNRTEAVGLAVTYKLVSRQ
ncbi:MAG: response regulator transcription factor [Chloroflexales bacterium]|nr:response regulator transcription factor [Chloroflexales bacterium]